MSSVLAAQRSGDVRAGLPLALAGVALACVSAALAGWLPLGFSIVTVFLFAGPHNWLELRYFLTRLPARWGKLRGFFLFAFSGVFLLTAWFAAITVFASGAGWSIEGQFNATALWNTVFLLWVLVLVQWRSRQNPRRDWFWTLPVGFGLLALIWIDPYIWSMGLVYAHPLVAFWMLDRELKRSRPAWRPAYHCALAAVPILLAVLWLRLGNAPPLPGDDALTARITRHAGAGIFEGVSSHFLVAAHTFLEMLHYGVWVVAIPLIALRMAPWDLRTTPLARR